MSEAVLSISVHEPVTEALRLFADYPLHHLPVVDESGLIGMLSSADMLKLEHFMPKSGSQAAAALLNDRFRIDTMMRRPVISAKPDDTIADAAASMASNGIHALPVVNENNHLVGIVTTTDIVAALLHGSRLKPGLEQHAASRQPTELEMRRAIAAAESATLNGTDADGIAALLLYLHERNALLEELRQDVTRYLRSGQDEQLHTRLLQEIDRLDRQAELSTRP
ncbi:MAG: CBS domain-containing protein [Steroidobacteraceae bacterium]